MEEAEDDCTQCSLLQINYESMRVITNRAGAVQTSMYTAYK